MTALILHPNDEHFYVDLQKEISSVLFSEQRIIIQSMPLWIELGDFDIKEKSKIKKVEIKEPLLSDDSIYCPVIVECDGRQVFSKLTLVCLYKGEKFVKEEAASLKEKPARLIKVFRLGLVQAEGPHAKSISKSEWCKLHNATATVE